MWRYWRSMRRHRRLGWSSLQSMIRVPNISHFVYIGSPGLHPNRRQDLVATRLYRQYRHSPDAGRRLAYINIYIYNIIFSIKHISSIYFGTEGPNVWSVTSWRRPQDQAIYFSCTIHYKLRQAGQQYFWIKLNCATITKRKKIYSNLLDRTWNAKPTRRIGTAAGLLSLCHAQLSSQCC